MFLEFFPPPSPKFSACPRTRNLTARKRRYVCSFVFQSEIVNYTHTRLRAKAGQARSICIRRAKQKRVHPRHRRACGTQEKDATGNRLETTQPACEQRRGKRAAFASAERSKKGCTRGIAALAARKKKTLCVLICFSIQNRKYTHTRLRAKAGQARSICIRRAKQKRVYPRHRRACGTQEKDATNARCVFWYTRQESNLRPSESESDTLSS